MAPFYWMCPLAGSLLDMDGEIVRTFDTRIDTRKWQSCNFDGSLSVSGDALPGEYHLAIMIIGSWTRQPSVQFTKRLPGR